MSNYKPLKDQLERASSVIHALTTPKGVEVSGFDLTLSPLSNRVKTIIREQIEGVSCAKEAPYTRNGIDQLMSRLEASIHYCNMIASLTNNQAIMWMFCDVSTMLEEALQLADEIEV